MLENKACLFHQATGEQMKNPACLFSIGPRQCCTDWRKYLSGGQIFTQDEKEKTDNAMTKIDTLAMKHLGIHPFDELPRGKRISSAKLRPISCKYSFKKENKDKPHTIETRFMTLEVDRKLFAITVQIPKNEIYIPDWYPHKELYFDYDCTNVDLTGKNFPAFSVAF